MPNETEFVDEFVYFKPYLPQSSSRLVNAKVVEQRSWKGDKDLSSEKQTLKGVGECHFQKLE